MSGIGSSRKPGGGGAGSLLSGNPLGRTRNSPGSNTPQYIDKRVVIDNELLICDARASTDFDNFLKDQIGNFGDNRMSYVRHKRSINKDSIKSHSKPIDSRISIDIEYLSSRK